MLRALDASAERFLADLGQIQRRLDRAQQQISSGRKLVNPSDDPDQVSTLLQTRVDLAQAQQIRKDLSHVKTEVDTAEKALQNAVLILDRALTLGAQGVNGTQTAETRNAIANEVEALLGQLVNIARTQAGGRYIFSGDSDQVAPYELDLLQPNGVTGYAGSAATRQTRHPSGTLFSIARTAQQIFDSAVPEENVFAAVNSLRVALTNNDEDAMRAALANLNGASRHVNAQLSFFGKAQNQVTEATDFAHDLEVRLKTALSSIEDADLASAILELEQARFGQEAALTARAQLPRTSLFDYLR